jgi:alkanesulfonate monooxygenase SsuD/methylene tetrahydromethanopterin reductase-like flavin-dependent oxidoreductase (luciferase family)
MTEWLLHHDLRAPGFGTPRAAVFSEALAMCTWAETKSCPRVVLSEHHGVDDGYLPAPLVFGAAVAARTERMRLMISALVLTLHDPVAVAEEVAVLDVLSGGRVELTVVPGYVPDEFAMFGIPFAGRGALFEEKLRVLRTALSGGTVVHRGTTFTVTPPPVQRPPFMIVGGSAPLRAARLGDAFLPAVPDEDAARRYVDECRRLGKGDGILLWPDGPLWVFVTDDPERSWAELGPHAVHEANGYGRWAAAVAPTASPYREVTSVDDLQASDLYAVVTPEQCVELAATLDVRAALRLKPLVGGLSPEVGWRSLELFVDRVLPHLA